MRTSGLPLLLIHLVLLSGSILLLILCRRQVYRFRNPQSVFFRNSTVFLILSMVLAAVCLLVTAAQIRIDGFAEWYSSILYITVFIAAIVVIVSGSKSLTSAKHYDKILRDAPDKPLSEDDLVYYQKEFSAVLENVRDSTAKRKSELDEMIPPAVLRRIRAKGVIRIVGRFVKKLLINTLASLVTRTDPAHLDGKIDTQTPEAVVREVYFAMQEIDLAAEKALEKLRSDDPWERRKAVLEWLAAWDDIDGSHYQFRYDDECYGREVAFLLYRFLHTLSPYAFNRIYRLYWREKICIGIRVNICENIRRIIKKRREAVSSSDA